MDLQAGQQSQSRAAEGYFLRDHGTLDQQWRAEAASQSNQGPCNRTLRDELGTELRGATVASTTPLAAAETILEKIGSELGHAHLRLIATASNVEGFLARTVGHFESNDVTGTGTASYQAEVDQDCPSAHAQRLLKLSDDIHKALTRLSLSVDRLGGLG